MSDAMTRPSPDWDKLARYLAGDASPEEMVAMRRWLDEHPDEALAIAALDAATKSAAPVSSIDVERALHRVKARREVRSPLGAFRTYARLAAAAAVVLIAGWGVSMLRSSRNTPSTDSHTFSTGVGVRDSVVLADGSRILLGPASRVVVRGRNVVLTGEAFFRVIHDAARPFTVVAGDVTIRDLGTEFSVHHDPAEPVRVVVREGLVEVSSASRTERLEPGDVGTVDVSGRVEASRGTATADDLAWTRGRLVFRNAPVTELAADLRRWYGVELQVTDSALMRRHFTGSFAGEPANRVLDVIALALGASIERRGDTAFVRSTRR
jgi:transmembrane sensor